jgi:hypothetical protein
MGATESWKSEGSRFCMGGIVAGGFYAGSGWRLLSARRGITTVEKPTCLFARIGR